MIRKHLFLENPYIGLPADMHPSDLQGWNDHREYFKGLVENPELIVEVGSWKGASALLLAELYPSAEIVCIDTWLGSKEMWTDKDDKSRYGALKLRYGHPTIQWEFMANVIRAGKENQITPMPLPSSIALDLLAEWNAKPDLIYLDGSHEYQDVCDDINRALRLHPKILCGDDFIHWKGVQDAVRECLTDFHVEPTGLWWCQG